MLVISIPCVFLAVVCEGVYMPCFLLINFIEDMEIDGLCLTIFKKRAS
jgi:hypothetical protein